MWTNVRQRRPAACRLLPAALNAIVDGGEVWILDSANYNTGPVTVGKSASILAIPGAVARVFVTRCTIEGTSTALDSETAGVGSAAIAVSYSMIANNNFAWVQSNTGSIIRTLGNNHITDNTSSSGFLTATALQ